MLTMIFQIASQRHALSCAQIVEVVPLVLLHEVPTGPTWLRGLFPYRGQLTPVVDLSQLLANRPSLDRLSSRIAITRVRSRNGEAWLIGLLAEKMTQVRQLRVSATALPSVSSSALGPMLMEDGGLLQIINEAALAERLKLGEVGWLVRSEVTDSEENREPTRA
jgi:chemotaxis-related protein WspB